MELSSYLYLSASLLWCCAPIVVAPWIWWGSYLVVTLLSSHRYYTLAFYGIPSLIHLALLSCRAQQKFLGVSICSLCGSWGLRLIAARFAGRCGTCYPIERVVSLVGGGVVPFDMPGLV